MAQSQHTLDLDRMDHCDLCEHQVLSPKGGYACGLTGQRPDFDFNCSKATFSQRAETAVKNTSLNYHLVASTRPRAMAKVYAAAVLGLVVVGIGFYVLHLFNEYGWVGTHPFFIMLLGLAALGGAARLYGVHRGQYLTVKKAKQKVDTVMDLYGISYKVNIVRGQKLHGKRTYEAQLEVSRSQQIP